MIYLLYIYISLSLSPSLSLSLSLPPSLSLYLDMKYITCYWSKVQGPLMVVRSIHLHPQASFSQIPGLLGFSICCLHQIGAGKQHQVQMHVGNTKGNHSTALS